MLRARIYDDLKQAMKDKQAEKLETLRFVWSSIKNVEIDVKHELKDEEVVKLLRTEVKRRKEAVEQFKRGERDDLAGEEISKLAVIEQYLPQMMKREEIVKVVEGIVAQGGDNFGAVMGQAMGKLKGKADGALVSEVVKEVMG